MTQFADSTSSSLDRLPPHSIESEMCLLASMLIGSDDRKLYTDMTAGLKRDMFFQTDHQLIFDGIVTLAERGAADGVLLREELIRRQLLDEVGGVAYLAT